jgi:galactokinase/mevalonate kinase-like predicted kinase
MVFRLSLMIILLLTGLSMASAECITDQPLDAQGRAVGDKEKALYLAKKAWQKRVASTVGKGKGFDPALAQNWVENYRQDDATKEVIVNVSGIPCY